MWLLILAGIISAVAIDVNHHSMLTAAKHIRRDRTDIGNHKQSDVVEYDLNIDPITHLEMIKQTIEMDKRIRRNPQTTNFDRGYDDFLRNYRRDNQGSGAVNYKVRDSGEERSESDENDDDDDNGDDDDEDDETSDEKSSQSKKVNNRDKKYKQKPKSDDDYERIKHESGKTKKSKYCKTEKRGNMLCNVCYNPRNDEKAESCKLNTEPKDKNYAYSNEKKYSHKENDDDRESFEEAREFTTKRPTHFNGPRPYNNRYPIKPIQPPYRRIPRPTGPYSIIRYRTVPYSRPQRIRIITIPGPPPLPPPTPLPSAQYNQRPYPFTVLESRPQRDTGWLKSRRPFSEQLTAPLNGSKLDEIELLPDHLNKNNDEDFTEFISKDWSKCRKYTEGELMCFECGEKKGGTSKECMFATKKKPEENRQIYAKANVFDYEKRSGEPPPRKTATGGRQAKIHPAWQINADASPAKPNSQKETKSTLERNPKTNRNNELKVQHRSTHGAKTNIKAKPKATTPFFKFNNHTISN